MIVTWAAREKYCLNADVNFSQWSDYVQSALSYLTAPKGLAAAWSLMTLARSISIYIYVLFFFSAAGTGPTRN